MVEGLFWNWTLFRFLGAGVPRAVPPAVDMAAIGDVVYVAVIDRVEDCCWQSGS
jgi:hypothetical protein